MGLRPAREGVKRGSSARAPCYIRSMRDRVFFPLAALAALAMIALALISPRGMGASLPSFSHPLTTLAPPPAPPADPAKAKARAAKARARAQAQELAK